MFAGDFDLAWPVSESSLARPQCSCLVKVLLAHPLLDDKYSKHFFMPYNTVQKNVF